MNTLLKYILSVPKTIWINLRYLPLNQALKFPICISYNTRFKVSGDVVIDGEQVRTAMIRIGFHSNDTCEYNATTSIIINKKGRIVFEGTAHIGKGSRIRVAGGSLELGDNFAISGCSTINCYKRISFGRDIQFSWDCLVMDCDAHKIYDEEGKVCNEAREIIFGDKVWIGCRSTIMKGSRIPSNCVIGACSFVSGSQFDENSIIVGTPARSKKKIKGWTL